MRDINSKNSSGFTIIETLVAISVLMIAVAGPLVVASKALNTALYARDQVIASYLAQESMEVIKNTRDNDLNNGGTWLQTIFPMTSSCTESNPCDADSMALPRIQIPCPATGCSIYYADATGYTHTAGTQSTIFKRYYYLSGPGGVSICDATANECEVNVEVVWNEGTVPYSIDLDSEIVNTKR